MIAHPRRPPFRGDGQVGTFYVPCEPEGTLSLRTRYPRNQNKVVPQAARRLALPPASLRSAVPPEGRTES